MNLMARRQECGCCWEVINAWSEERKGTIRLSMITREYMVNTFGEDKIERARTLSDGLKMIESRLAAIGKA